MSLVSDIIHGKHDTELESLITVAVERRKLLRKSMGLVTLHEIAVGQEVRLKNIRPKYMIGRFGTVKAKTGTKFVIEFPGDNGRLFTVPATCVEPVVGVRNHE